jgi:hypothetical protein
MAAATFPWGTQYAPDRVHSCGTCLRRPRRRPELAGIQLSHGFTPELIAGLVLAGLATVVTDTARVGGQTIKVELVMITDAGRSAIER